MATGGSAASQVADTPEARETFQAIQGITERHIQAVVLPTLNEVMRQVIDHKVRGEHPADQRWSERAMPSPNWQERVERADELVDELMSGIRTLPGEVTDAIIDPEQHPQFMVGANMKATLVELRDLYGSKGTIDQAIEAIKGVYPAVVTEADRQ